MKKVIANYLCNIRSISDQSQYLSEFYILKNIKTDEYSIQEVISEGGGWGRPVISNAKERSVKDFERSWGVNIEELLLED